MLRHSNTAFGLSIVHLARHGDPELRDYLTENMTFYGPADKLSKTVKTVRSRRGRLASNWEAEPVHIHGNCFTLEGLSNQLPQNNAFSLTLLDRALDKGQVRDLVCGTCLSAHPFDLPDVLERVTAAEQHLTFTFWVDELLAGRIRNIHHWKGVNFGAATMLSLLHSTLPPLYEPHHAVVNDLVAAQKARLDDYLDSRTMRRAARHRDAAHDAWPQWVRVPWLPLPHLGGARVDEPEAILMAGIGASQQLAALPGSAGHGLLALMPEWYIREHRRWRPLKDLDHLAYEPDYTVDELQTALTLRSDNYDADDYDGPTFNTLLRAVRAAS